MLALLRRPDLLVGHSRRLPRLLEQVLDLPERQGRDDRRGDGAATARDFQRAVNFLSPGANTSTRTPFASLPGLEGHARNRRPPGSTQRRSVPSDQVGRQKGAWNPFQLVLKKAG